MLRAYGLLARRAQALASARLQQPDHVLQARIVAVLWSWDITKLLGPAKWTCFYLSVVLDVFSRYVVGWMIAHRESAAFAHKLTAEACERQRIAVGQLTLHADHGSSMTSKPVALLLADPPAPTPAPVEPAPAEAVAPPAPAPAPAPQVAKALAPKPVEPETLIAEKPRAAEPAKPAELKPITPKPLENGGWDRLFTILRPRRSEVASSRIGSARQSIFERHAARYGK